MNAKEGQTYVCTKSNRRWWTKDKEYKVVLNNYGEPCLVDDDYGQWVIGNLKSLDYQFKLKEETIFDLNKLTTYQLLEYVDLLKAKESAESSLNEFMKRVTK